MAPSAGQLPGETRLGSMLLKKWCLSNLLGIKCYHHVWKDDGRQTTKQQPLLAIVQAQRLSLFGHPGELEVTTRTPSHHVDEDYPAGPGII